MGACPTVLPHYIDLVSCALVSGRYHYGYYDCYSDDYYYYYYYYYYYFYSRGVQVIGSFRSAGLRRPAAYQGGVPNNNTNTACS